MASVKLTKRLCDQATYQGDGRSRSLLWDSEVRGLALRVFPSGQKSWVLSFRVRGRSRLSTLGKYGVMTLEQARGRARKELVAVADGSDPLEERAKERAMGMSVRQVAETFLAEYCERSKSLKSTDAIRRRLERTLLRHLGSRPAASIRRSDIAQLHGRLTREGGPYEANRVLSVVSKLYAFAAEQGLVPEEMVNPGRGISRNVEAARERLLTDEEISRILNAIDEHTQNVFIAAAFKLLLLLGSRKGEILSTRWEDIDFSRKLLVHVDTKNKRPHVVSLPEPAVEILRGLPRLNEYVFPGDRPESPLVNIDKTWRRVRAAAGLTDLRLHDLRRNFGAKLAKNGTPLMVISKSMNHKTSSVTAKHYAILTPAVAVEPVAQLGEQLRALGLKTGTTPAAGG